MQYTVKLTNVVDADGNSIIETTVDGKTVTIDNYEKELSSDKIADAKAAFDKILNRIWGPDTTDGTTAGYTLIYNSNKGTFESIGGNDKDGKALTSQKLNLKDVLSTGYPTSEKDNKNSNFANIDVDFSSSTNRSNGGKSSMRVDRGDTTGDGAGKKLGAMIGLAVDSSGKIYGSYDNGNTELLGQIAVAQFANASGLEKVGNNCYQTTLNSGDFDGIGVEVDADGSSIASGELEMSNVDLSSQFTDMIITQRGFQANSRVITVSDTLLEELINLKR
jgi:flagellar hook protein FlgE